MADDTPLNAQQLRFVAEYVADPRSKADAYRRAYNVPNMATSAASACACRLLTDARIQTEIIATRHDWCKKYRVTFRTTLRKLASIALGDAGDLYESDDENNGMPKPRPWNDITPAARKNIKTVKFKRRKLKDAANCVYELEELEYRVADQEWALGKLCVYLGITKGSLTADDLRAILAGTHAAPTAPLAIEGGPAAVESGDKPTVVTGRHADE